jgi:hypothetical protein
MENLKNETIILTKNIWKTLPINHFFHATSGLNANQKTDVKLKTDGQFFYIEFDCCDNAFVDENTYFEHNSEMWNQEVFEIFISKGNDIPNRYLEIEINPNNALFVGWITNSSGMKPDSCDFIDHNSAGIMHGVQKIKEAWKGFLTIPLSLMGEVSDQYRINFFRIVSFKSHQQKDWKCELSDCDFTCWSPTLSGESPAFHRPAAFGFLQIN